jgi:hypothetical protein
MVCYEEGLMLLLASPEAGRREQGIARMKIGQGLNAKGPDLSARPFR